MAGLINDIIMNSPALYRLSEKLINNNLALFFTKKDAKLMKFINFKIKGISFHEI